MKTEQMYTFNSIANAAEILQLHPSNISHCLRYHRPNRAGFAFTYEGEDITKNLTPNPKNGKHVICTDIRSGKQEIYISMTAAANALGLDVSNICSGAKGRLKRVGNYTFQYEKEKNNG